MRWFKHDSNAHTDAKIQKILMRYGADGYAIYWYCLELIAGKVDAKNITFELEHDAEIIGYVLKIDSARVEEIMCYMVNVDLFEEQNGVITCLKMAHRLDDTNSRNPHIKEMVAQITRDFPSGYPEESPKDPEESSARVDKIRLEPKHTSVPSCPHDAIIDLYHEHCPTLPRVKIWTDKRKGYLKARWRENEKHQSLQFWEDLFKHVNRSPFLRGETGDRKWQASLEFIVRESGFVKIIEGEYHE